MTYYRTDYATLELKAREIRTNAPEQFSVKKLARAMGCSNHASSKVYFKILRGEI